MGARNVKNDITIEVVILFLINRQIREIFPKHRLLLNNRFSRDFQTILIIVYFGLITVGLSANLTVIYVVARRAQMHTSRNLYVVNLAISDMTLCLVCMPFTLTSILRHQWTMGTAFCKLVPLLQGTNIMVSVGTITAIAIDRYWVIVRGSTAAQNERRSVYFSIATVWLLAVLTTFPVAYYQVGNHSHVYRSTFCKQKKIYLIYLFSYPEYILKTTRRWKMTGR